MKNYAMRKYEDTLYTREFDLLLSWGATHLTGVDGKFTSRDQIEVEWKNKKDKHTSLNKGLEMFSSDVSRARGILGRTVEIGVHDLEAPNIQLALEVLDKVVFLSEAVTEFPYRDEFPEGFSGKITDLFTEITTYGAPSTPRLIPLNRWRRRIVKFIPDNLHYLFPWYTEWLNIPADTLEEIIQKWNDLQEGKLSKFSVPPAEMSALWGNIKADPALVYHLRKHGRLHDQMSKVIRDYARVRVFK